MMETLCEELQTSSNPAHAPLYVRLYDALRFVVSSYFTFVRDARQIYVMASCHPPGSSIRKALETCMAKGMHWPTAQRVSTFYGLCLRALMLASKPLSFSPPPPPPLPPLQT